MIRYETVQAVAKTALAAWGSDVAVVDDLVQDIFVWYLKRPSAQEILAEADAPMQRRIINKAATQILVEETLAGDERWGYNVYNPEAIKDHLKGRSTNKYLQRVMPQALANLQRKNPRYIEAIEHRYTYGVVPPQGSEQVRLSRALVELTRHVNSLVINGEDHNPDAVPAESRKGSGGKSDPTADMALAMIEKGDEPIELTNEEGFVTGSTTYRTELANVFDDWMVRPTVDSSPGSHLSVIDGGLGDRTEMYQAQVFPDLFPDEKPMLVDNWPLEDRRMYCGGEWTPGYLRLVKEVG
ncbi:hypothetical protein SHEEN_53 [Mycobacterium phage Sheen]|uniref:Helix-turn-helix DNA binding domain protein n=1 Tax=Mycobacterium phage Sheen TaxID=1589274 RepID=A0A0B5A5Y1_9CAUD|nr:sigma-K factor [Mycobacterium phage Sheen]AJD82471.1 hypothetical protein SHEEN_53 [Mycobacterium phage Sheen]